MSEIPGNSKYGTDTLQVISAANKFNFWMYNTIKPFCSGDILEIGSGIGNISQFFIKEGANITLSDIEKSYFPLLKDKFSEHENFRGVIQLDFSDEKLEENYPELTGKFDTVFALNVVEHIPDHEQALKNAYKLLRKGGRVVILVPAYQFLFNDFDRQLDHQRRYTSESLKRVITGGGFKVTSSQYFNFIAIFGWFISGNLLRKKMIPGGQMKLYDNLVPLWKVLDRFTNRFAGLSVIQVGEKI